MGKILNPEERVDEIPRLAVHHFEPAIRDRSGNLVIQGKTLAFTGHRPNALGGYNENHPINRWVKSELDVWISHFMSEGFETFISGGALGVDQWAAEIVIRHGGRLIVARPFPSQAKRWPKASQDRYEKILSHAAEVVDVSDDPYSPEKMHLRNQWMVDHSHALLAVFNGTPGGTANCIRYAKSKGRQIYLIDPTKAE